jgi:hypothetical protein
MDYIRDKEQLRANLSHIKVLMVSFGNLIEQVKGVHDGHQDFVESRKGETFGLLLKDMADTDDL